MVAVDGGLEPAAERRALGPADLSVVRSNAPHRLKRRAQGKPEPAGIVNDSAQCRGGALPEIMAIIGRLKPTTTVTITSKCAV